MTKYLSFKGFRFLVCVFIIITLNFLIPRLMPGNPVIMMLGEDAAALSPREYLELEQEYGLDKPLIIQYNKYLKSLVTGNLGYSFHYRQPVASLIDKHLTWTLMLVLPSLVLSSILAILLGSLAGWRAGSRLDLSLTLGSLIFYAMPQFLLAMIVLAFFGYKMGWFPLSGMYSGNKSSLFFTIIDTLWHLLLPVTVLTLAALPSKFMIMRNSVARVKQESYVIYALAKGLSESRVLFIHILKNACLPLLNVVALNLGFLVSGALLVEIVFSINGMGSLIYEAALYRDYPVLQACFLVLTLFVVFSNALADLLCGILDPRVRV